MKKSLTIVEDLTCLWPGASICGEGPLWVPDQQELYWVDIDGCMAHSYKLEDGSVRS